MEIKSRIIPAKPRNKELYFLKGTGGTVVSSSSGSNLGITTPLYWRLIDTDEFDLPLENPYISTNYPIVTKVLPPETIEDPEDPEAPTNILNYLQIGDARLVYEDDALKVIKENGDPLSFYATGALSAYNLNGTDDPETTIFSIADAVDVSITNPSIDDLLKYNGTKWVNVPMSSLVTGGGGDGSVTSVGLSVPTGLSVTGSPITSSGTLAISFASGYSIPTTTKQGQWDTAYSQRHTHNNKTVIDTLTQGHINVLNKLSLDAQGNVKVDATLWATGGVSAYGLGEGGSSGGGGSNVTWGTASGGYIPLTVEGVSKSVALSTHTHSQYALSNHTHSQYATTTHNHSGVYEPVFTKNTAFNKNFGTTSTTVARGNHTHNYLSLTGGTLTGNLTAPTFIGALSGNASSATKLQTARTIAGVSFNGTANIAIPFANLSNKPDTLAGYGITDAEVDSLIVNGKSFMYDNLTMAEGDIIGYGKIEAPLFKGTKVDFGNGFTIEPSGNELVFKYGGLVKQRMLQDGSFAATGELTAYASGASGYSEFLPLSGGTLTGNLNLGSGVIIGTASRPLAVRGSTFKYNNSDVLHKGNIASAALPSISLSDGWTIEVQSSPSALLIKKNGVIKGTFNA